MSLSSNSTLSNTDTLLMEELKSRIRSTIIETKVAAKEEEFSKPSSFRIWAGTWNVNGKFVEEEIKLWIKNEGLKLFDMYVFGLEEMVPLTLSSILFNINVDTMMNRWIESILSTLKSIHGVSFQCIAAKSLVGVSLLVVVPTTTKHTFSSIQESSLPVGYYGLFGNKGAVAFSIKVDDSPLHFVCCHLSPHQSNEPLRNREFSRILHEIVFTSGSIQSASSILLVGDLNYRLNTSLSKTALISGYATNPLFQLESDQLLHLMKSHSLFNSFAEEPIQFPPSYKYKPHSDELNYKRSPAWCDRILFKGKWSCKNYHSVMKTMCSDHKAVTASLETEIRVIDQKKKEEVRKQIEKEVLIKEGVSELVIQQTELDFRSVYPGKKTTQLLVIENTGDGNGYYQILPTSQTKEWFTIQDIQGMIEPHSKKEIEIELNCLPRHCRCIHRGLDVLNGSFVVDLIGQEKKKIYCKGSIQKTSSSFISSPYFWFWSCVGLASLIEVIQRWYNCVFHKHLQLNLYYFQ